MVPTAAVLNVTVVTPTQNTYVEVYPNGDGPSGASDLSGKGGLTTGYGMPGLAAALDSTLTLKIIAG